ncbi:MAG TPA: hypothetical protein VFQ65_16165 [Kofleriaceae bacterium]|nr:hypothetical protein [Kofleriaceae bacterium]
MRCCSIAMISLVCACAHHGATAGGPTPNADVQEFAALAWVPDQPTYVWTAHSVRDAQRSIDDVIDSFGMLSGATAADAGHALEHVLSVDPLSESGTQKLGVDPAGSIAMFSEGLDPTIVVQLASPDTTHAFFDSVKATNGVATQSVIVDGIEVSTVKLFGHVRASWAIAKSGEGPTRSTAGGGAKVDDKTWLWAHFAFGVDRPTPDGEWFAKAHAAHAGAWTKSFAWAKDLRAKLAAKATGLLGFFDVHALLAIARAHAPKDALACLDLVQPIGLAGFAIEGDGRHAGGRLALDLGPAAQRIAAAVLPAPAGFERLAQIAPITAQWNLDIGAVASAIAPCWRTIGGDMDFLTRYGVRTARVAVMTIDPDKPRDSTGVFAADLSDATYLRGLLDQIPHRSMAENDRAYGGIAGHRISIPFIISLDYILNDRLAMLALGDGLLDKAVTGTPAPPPLFALDLIVPGLSEGAWKFVIAKATNEWFAKRATALLQGWHDGHLRVTIDHDALVLEASGNRR